MKTITMKMWEEAGDFGKIADPGDYVEECIVDDFRDAVPPASMKAGYLQCGEPYSHEYVEEHDWYAPTFATFVREGDQWKYCGNCFLGKTEPPRKEEKTK